ncbi:hypothetical protein [Dactylosporangium salmoneum]|uniref:Uncharacterized protein n=1 Tax=Dactylosporangium salmoneum TaxID=53361 RepID=A0ABP5TMG8_9ACTN
MGLHTGYIVATATQADLLDELARHTGEFTTGEVVARTEDAESDDGQLDMVIGELDGRAFLIDGAMVLSTVPDMILAMSERLGTVLGCGAETVSGSYWLTAARDGELLRHIFVSHASMTRGMAIQDPLPFEDGESYAEGGGKGVFTAMEHFGLSPSAWLASGPATVVRYDATRLPQDGSIARITQEHFERYQRPEDEWLNDIVAVSKES